MKSVDAFGRRNLVLLRVSNPAIAPWDKFLRQNMPGSDRLAQTALAKLVLELSNRNLRKSATAVKEFSDQTNLSLPCSL
jgi:hypothetical protein